MSSVLNNDSCLAPKKIPPPADDDLPICTGQPFREETAKAIAAILDCAITAEALELTGVHHTLFTNPMDHRCHHPISKGR